MATETESLWGKVYISNMHQTADNIQHDFVLLINHYHRHSPTSI